MGAFSGVRVVDVSDRLSGAFAARLLADYGADVVLAEPPRGHPLRREPPFVDGRPGADGSVVHAYANWNKRSIVVADDGKLAELIRNADLVVSTGRHVTVPAETIHLSITPHGLDGPLAGVPGNHLTACARTGWALMNAFRDEPPVQLPVDQTGYLAGIVGFTAAAAALFDRDGGGELVDMSELEVLTLTTAPWATASVFRGEDTDGGPGGRRARGRAGPLYETADGRIVLGFGEWQDWAGAMRLIGLPELADDRLLLPVFRRHQQNLRPVAAAAERTVRKLERWPLFKGLGAMRCGSGVLQDMSDLVHDEQFAARKFIVETTIEGRPVRSPGAPALTTPELWHLRKPAPRLGDAATVDAASHPIRPARPPRRARRDAGSRPLDGVRVLAFTQAWSGTLGTELLAFLGADIVQIERLERSDIWRNAAAGVPAGISDPSRRQLAQHTQGLYNSVNLDKRAITLDMTDERGRELFWRLVPRFDIVAENFVPHVMPKWGITLETLAERRPDVVFASVSGFGLGGPHTLFPANGSTIEPMSGLSSVHGYEDASGMNTGGLLPDPTTGMVFAGAIVAALHERRRTGKPQRIDVSMMEAVAITLGDAIMQLDAGGGVRGPAGNRHPRIAPHACFPAANDSWVALAAETEEAWRGLADRLDIGGDERFSTMVDRKRHENALNQAIAAWTTSREAQDITAELAPLGVCVAPIIRLTDLLDKPDPHLVERGFLRIVDHPESGANLLAQVPWKLGGRANPPLRPAPCIGEHSRSVLQAELEMSNDEYETLIAAGVTGAL